MTYKEIYENKCAHLKDEIERIEKLGGNLRGIPIIIKMLMNRVEAKVEQLKELSKDSIKEVESVYTDALHELTFIEENLGKFNLAYKEQIKIKEKLDLLNIDEILKIKNNDLKIIVETMENMMTSLNSIAKYFPKDVSELQENLYTNAYKIIKTELSNTLNSKMLEIIIKNKEENRINPLILKDIKTYLKSSNLTPEEHQNLYMLYDENSKNENFVTKETILFIAYLQDRNKIKKLIEEHYYKLYADVVENKEFLDKHFNDFESDTSYYEEVIKSKKKNIRKTTEMIITKISALALSILLLGGLCLKGHKIMKKELTIIKYETTLDKASSFKDKDITTFNNTFMREKIDHPYVLTEYSGLFYEDGEPVQYSMDYAFDYVEGTSAADYLDIDTKDLKPIGELETNNISYLYKSELDNRKVYIYHQNFDKSETETDTTELYFIDAMMLLVSIFFEYGLFKMNYPKIKYIMNKRNKTIEDYEEIVNYINELREEMLSHNIKIEEFENAYQELINISSSLGVNFEKSELDNAFEENKEFKLKINQYRKLK